MKKIYDIRVTSTQFGKSDGTVHALGMSKKEANEYCKLMNNTPCYSNWARYETVERCL